VAEARGYPRPMAGRASKLRASATLGVTAGLGVTAALALAGPPAVDPAARAAFDSKCGVFPKPGPGVSATAASLPDQRAWNQDISEAPVDPRSEQIIAHINSHGADALHPDFGSPREYGIPFRVVGKRAKRVGARFTAYGDESDHGRYRLPLDTPIEGGRRADGDRHAIGYDRARCKLYELYRAFPRKRRWDADSGVIWNLRSAALRRQGWTSADAAGLPIFAGLVRRDEVRRGRIDHAIRVTFESTRDAWLRPATHCAGDTSSPNAPPMGMRLRLRAGYDISGIGGEARVIAAALKRYGFIVADNGSNWFFSGATDRRWNDDNLNQLKEIPGAAFEVVRSAASVHVC
jgi:hypothetical protein